MHKTPLWLRRLFVGGISATTMLTVAGIAIAGPASATPGATASRLAGSNRFATAAVIAAAAFPSGAKTVLVASGLDTNLPDSLASSYLAAQENGGTGAPILLVTNSSVPAETSAAIAALHATNIVVVGGTAAVSDAVLATLQGEVTGAVTRVAGATRFDTADAVDSVTGMMAVGSVGGAKTALVADGQDANLVDSLGGSPISYAKNFPLFLVNGSTGSLSSTDLSIMKTDGITNAIILGGSAAVGVQVPTQLTANAITSVIESGSNRSQTAQVLADYAIANLGFTNTTFDVASGAQDHLVDSLAGGPYGGSHKAPTLITDSVDAPGYVVNFATEHASTETSFVKFGGTAAISDANEALILAALKVTTAGQVALSSSSVNPGGTLSGTITAPASVSALTVSGCGLSSQAVTYSTGTISVTIPAATAPGPCTLTFSATVAGVPVTTTIPITVTPVAVGTLSSVSPSTLTFSGAAGATNIAPEVVTVSNSSTNGASLTFSATAATLGGAADFSINNSANVGQTCSSSVTLTPGQSCQLGVQYSPAVGEANATVDNATLTINDSGANAEIVALTGTVTTTSASTGLGTPPTAGENAPVLTAAAITTNNFAKSGNSIVQFTFSQPVNPNTAGDLYLAGYDTGRSVAAASANVDATNPDVIDAAFGPSVDVASYTIAVADNTGAATNDSGTSSAVTGNGGAGNGLNNPLGSVALGGSTGAASTTTGATTAPDLVSAALNPANNLQVIYTFDKAVASVNSADDFGYYTAAGVPATTGATVDASFVPGSTQVPIDFAASAATSVRFEVRLDAVLGNAGYNPIGSAPNTVSTASPDLTAVTGVPGNSFQYDFHFDKTVTAGPAGDYNLFLNDATDITGNTIVNVLNGNTVRVDFSSTLTPADVANVVLGAVVEGAATNTASGLTNTVGAEPVSGLVTNGNLTDGPQLVSAVANVAANTVTYTFNQEVNDPSFAGFFVINASGVPAFANTAGAQGDTVVTTFLAGQLSGAVGAGVTNAYGDGYETAGNNNFAVYNSSFFENPPGDVTLAP